MICFENHRFLSIHEDRFVEEQYDYLAARYETLFGRPAPRTLREFVGRGDYGRLWGIYAEISRLEAGYEEYLEELAIDIVCSIYPGCDLSMFRRVEIRGDTALIEDQLVPAVEMDLEDEPVDPYDFFRLPEHIRDEIEKRITMNMLIHGASIHQKLTLFFLAQSELGKIHPELVDLYNESVLLSDLMYLLVEVSDLSGDATAAYAGGFNEISFDGDEPQVTAVALNFPMLLHELSKGMLEILAMHGINDIPEDELREILKWADRYECEIPLYRVGPPIWRRFIADIRPGKLPETLMEVAMADPDEVHEMLERLTR
jgi:hypothetical protein